MSNNPIYRILILTDSNRNYLETVLTNDILYTIQNIFSAGQTLFGNVHRLSRIVYEETMSSESAAQQRLKELQSYTRMQKERLVRRHNPNWLNLYPIRPIVNSTSVTNAQAC